MHRIANPFSPVRLRAAPPPRLAGLNAFTGIRPLRCSGDSLMDMQRLGAATGVIRAPAAALKGLGHRLH
jgi:hypothetical protein